MSNKSGTSSQVISTPSGGGGAQRAWRDVLARPPYGYGQLHRPYRPAARAQRVPAGAKPRLQYGERERSLRPGLGPERARRESEDLEGGAALRGPGYVHPLRGRGPRSGGDGRCRDALPAADGGALRAHHALPRRRGGLLGGAEQGRAEELLWNASPGRRGCKLAGPRHRR